MRSIRIIAAARGVPGDLAYFALLGLCCLSSGCVLRGSEGCAIFPTPTGVGSISGAVRALGTKQPLPGAEVLATLHGSDGKAMCWWKRVTTDRSGAYVMTDLPDGRFSLAVNTQIATTPEVPFHGVFYPGVQDEADAALIMLPKGRRLVGVDFMLAGPLATREFAVQLIWPDGRPAIGETVMVSDARGNDAGRAVIDESGSGTFKGCTETTYIFRAQRLGGTRTDVVHAEPVAVAAGNASTRVSLILSSPGYGIAHHRGEYRLAPNPSPAQAPR